MTTADSEAFHSACLTDLVCKHLYDQELSSNVTRFDDIARTLIAAWPVTFQSVETLVSSPDRLRSLYLVASAASNQCGFNQWAPFGKCVFIAPFERPSAIFVDVVVVVFILIGLIGGAMFVWKKMGHPDPIETAIEPIVPVNQDADKSFAENDLVLMLVQNGRLIKLQIMGTLPQSSTLPSIDPLKRAHHEPLQATVDSLLVHSHGMEYARSLRGRR